MVSIPKIDYKIELETDRLIFRKFVREDADMIFELNSDDEVMKYTANRPFESLQAAQDFLHSYDHYEKYDYGRWAINLKLNGEFIGWCGLRYNPEKDETDVGFRFFAHYWGNGYATESARAVISHGFEKYGLKKIIAVIREDNIQTHKIVRKLGMKFHKYFNENGHKWAQYCVE